MSTEAIQFDRVEAEAKLMYAVIVAGKSAKFAERAMQQLCSHSRGMSPFEMLRRLIDDDYLERALEMARVGNYTKIGKCFRQLAAGAIDLETCSPDDLEKIHGIGPKTSRFFIMWVRPDEHYAALDVHVLRWMRSKGHAAPVATPTGPRYAVLEKAFLAEAENRGMTPRELDSAIWDAASTGKELPA